MSSTSRLARVLLVGLAAFVGSTLHPALRGQVPDRERPSGQFLALEPLRRELDRAPASDWPMYRANPARTGQGPGDVPFLEPRWQARTVERPETRRHLDAARKYLEYAQEPTLPAFFPVTAGNKLIYRSYAGLHAIDLGTGRELWNMPFPLSFEGVVRDPGRKVQVDQWMQVYTAGALATPRGVNRGIAGGGFQPGGTGFGGTPAVSWAGTLLFNNCIQGTLSTDRQRVYAVEDLPVPPPFGLVAQGEAGNPRPFGPLRDAVYHNRLRAIDLETGKLVWEVGGRGDGELADSLFLGPPLPLDGRLYVLADKGGELRLLCLNPQRGQVVWTQTLATFRDQILLDARRRVQAAHLSYGDGVLVCATGAGSVLGVELGTRSLLWAHAYRAPDPPGDPGRPVVPLRLSNASWKTAPPVIRSGKVVFTAPDSDAVHCLNLRDGTPLWKAARSENDLYLAHVHKDKVLIAGRQSCRALGLADGKELWQVETGTPSGQGAAGGAVYYLPLQRGAVCAIDLDRGAIVTRTSPREGEVPGNLLFHDGDVIAQSVERVAVYPQLKVKLAQINERLGRDPRDPTGLTERGALRIDQGDLSAAVADLRTALANHPPPELLPRTRLKLYEALTRWFERDFRAAEKHLDEYLDLCRMVLAEDAPAGPHWQMREERQRRLATYFALLARGREQHGRPAEALDAYRQLYDLGPAGLLSGVDEPFLKARPDAWVQGRVATLLAKASAPDRRAIEEQIAREWQAVRAAGNMDALERFVALYGLACAEGREARLELAERLTEDPERGRFVEAELHLLPLREQTDRALAARAVEALARLAARKGLMDDAMDHYRTLGRDFAQVVVRDGKTGAMLLDERATDKRLLAQAHQGPPAWDGAPLKAAAVPVNAPLKGTLVFFEPAGDVPPSLQRHRLVLDMAGHRLKLLDRATGAEVWGQRLTLGRPINHLAETARLGLRVPYRTVGHLAVLHLGHLLCGLDLIERRVLWQKDLLEGASFPEQVGLMLNPEHGWELTESGFRERLTGRLGRVEATVIWLQTARGLVGLDPVRGDVLWARSELTAGTDFFGDHEHLYLLGEGPNTTRAFRARDGAAVEVPRFPNVFQVRQTLGGSRVLVVNSAADGLQLLLHDLYTGKTIWKKSYPAARQVLHSTDPSLTGIVEAEGNVTVLDARTGKELLRTTVDPQDLDKVEAVRLLHDRTRFYLAFQRPIDPSTRILQPVEANAMGTRSGVPVNGMLYAFDRAGGELAWKSRLTCQWIVRDRFEDLPVLLCASRFIRQSGPRGNQQQVTATRSYDKKTGKMLYDQEVIITDGSAPPALLFHTLHMDPRSGTIDLISPRLRIRHAPRSEE